MEEFYEKTTNRPVAHPTEFDRFFGGFELVEPGLVWAPDWHPDGNALFKQGRSQRMIAGVAAR